MDTDTEAAFAAIVADPRYQTNLDWGDPRPGHPEGTVRAHIAEIRPNLEALRHKLTDDEYGKLRLLVHTHDTFKAEAKPGTAITDPRSHASLARAFLAEFVADPDLLAMCQYHDEPFALWRQAESKGACNPQRLAALRANISDWDLFLAFNLIDGCTAGKSRAPLLWLFEVAPGSGRFAAADVR